MKLKNKIIAAAVLLPLLFSSGCSYLSSDLTALAKYDYSEFELVQFEEPKDGAQTATISTDMGDMTFVLYPEYAPNTVSNFVKWVKEGFYDGKPIFGLVNDVYFLSGATDAEGKTGETEDGEFIDNEYSVKLWSFKGALMAYSQEANKCDSRFFVCGNYDAEASEYEEIRSYKDENDNQFYPEELVNALETYQNVGGFSGVYSIYGQLISGFDVLDRILSASVDEETAKPREELKINTITLGEYKSDGAYKCQIPEKIQKPVEETTAAE